MHFVTLHTFVHYYQQSLPVFQANNGSVAFFYLTLCMNAIMLSFSVGVHVKARRSNVKQQLTTCKYLYEGQGISSTTTTKLRSTQIQ